MGKSSLLVVLGLSAIVAFFVLKMNANSRENLSTTIEMYDRTQARLIANTGVEVYLEKLYSDPTLINTTSSPQSLFNGSYVVNLSGTLPSVRVTSTATFQNTTHIAVADAILEPIQLPRMPGGVYISTQSVVSAKEIGAMEVSGLDHDTSGVVKGSGKPAVWAVGVDDETQRQDILNNVLKPENLEGLINKETGETGFPSVGVDNLSIEWGEIYQYLANTADQTFINDVPKGANLGTLPNPKITLINASASENKTVIVNDGRGAGILVVNGNIKFAGNFSYKGIILCYKNTDLTFESTGTNQVLGGVIIAGQSVGFKLNGTMNVKHSMDVINALKSKLKADGFSILSWYE